MVRQIKSHNFIFIGIMANCGRDIRPNMLLLLCVSRFCICMFLWTFEFRKKSNKNIPKHLFELLFRWNRKFDELTSRCHRSFHSFFLSCTAIGWPFLTFKMKWCEFVFFLLKTDKWPPFGEHLVQFWILQMIQFNFAPFVFGFGTPLDVSLMQIAKCVYLICARQFIWMVWKLNELAATMLFII